MNVETFLNDLCTHLGLSDDATFDEILAAVKASRPKLPDLTREERWALAQHLYESSPDGPVQNWTWDKAPNCVHTVWLEVAAKAVEALR